jgi:hypothetical protein
LSRGVLWLALHRPNASLAAGALSFVNFGAAVDRSVVPRDIQSEVTKWVRDLGVSEKDMEVLTANDNADEDHSAMFETIFIGYGSTPEGEAMILDGARESLDMMGTFYDALDQEMTRCK